jgi:hypothetical protein
MPIAIEKRLIFLYVATVVAIVISLAAVAIDDHYRHQPGGTNKQQTKKTVQASPRS